MQKTKKLVALVLVAILVLCQTATITSAASSPKQDTLTKVNLIRTLSTKTPNRGQTLPFRATGWIWSGLSGTTLVTRAELEEHFGMLYNDGFANSVASVNIEGLSDVFYPLRALAEKNGCELLWYSEKDANGVTQNYVFITERVEGGSWIQIEDTFYEKNFTAWNPKQPHLMYASEKLANGSYRVAYYPGVVTVPASSVTKVIAQK